MTSTYRIARFYRDLDAPLTGELRHGDVVYLATITDTSTGKSHTALSPTPYVTNMSGEERVYGWCGTTNNVSVHADGLAVVVRLLDQVTEYEYGMTTEGYTRVRVRLDATGDPTFEVRKDIDGAYTVRVGGPDRYTPEEEADLRARYAKVDAEYWEERERDDEEHFAALEREQRAAWEAEQAARATPDRAARDARLAAELEQAATGPVIGPRWIGDEIRAEIREQGLRHKNLIEHITPDVLPEGCSLHVRWELVDGQYVQLNCVHTDQFLNGQGDVDRHLVQIEQGLLGLPEGTLAARLTAGMRIARYNEENTAGVVATDAGGVVVFRDADGEIVCTARYLQGGVTLPQHLINEHWDGARIDAREYTATAY
ncbi:hypothetical protein GXB85_13550 [Cellulomonas sp. APG4]|uniref:hypothetical protein n=1 Tax=Cellulomonas sp. APG4 TaxID=1538656 RepID=UPI001379D7EB|nr:hypothetical protein [Cellulomonas sp. APG4]NCT91967.1 hypothetical protein [Cellulomonas sp. APG4]